MRLFLLLGCCLFLFGSVAPEAMVDSDNLPVRAGKDYALLFAVDDYSVNARFYDLPNPIESANNIADELREMFAFRARVVPDASRETIYDELRTYQNKSFGPDDQLFLFFSGHGDFDEFEKKGYFVPRTGDRIDLTTLGNIITQIPCRHILVAIDACYSGTIDQEIAFQGDFVPRRPGQTAASERDILIANQLRNKSRLLLTSGTKVRTPSSAGGSPFAKAILAALRQSYTIGDGLVLYKDLEAKLERVRPKPYYGVLRGHEDGSFVFVANTSVKPPPPPDNMVFIKGGTFQMGDLFGDGHNNEKSVHTVTLSDFYLSRTELMVGEFANFVEATAYVTDAEKGDGSYIWTGSDYEKRTGVSWRDDTGGNTRNAREYNHPVIHVSWNDAVAYCNWLSGEHGLAHVYKISGTTVTANRSANGYRLPTEAEWEYGARSGGKKEKWAGTSTESSLAQFANYSGKGDGYERTAPVGMLRANNLGLADMSGNVWEWCWDWYDSGSYRVFRGGGWYSMPDGCRAAIRSINAPKLRYDSVGFRLARSSR